MKSESEIKEELERLEKLLAQTKDMYGQAELDCAITALEWCLNISSEPLSKIYGE
jgi:hypothetical protein